MAFECFLHPLSCLAKIMRQYQWDIGKAIRYINGIWYRWIFTQRLRRFHLYWINLVVTNTRGRVTPLAILIKIKGSLSIIDHKFFVIKKAMKPFHIFNTSQVNNKLKTRGACLVSYDENIRNVVSNRRLNYKEEGAWKTSSIIKLYSFGNGTRLRLG